MLDVTVEGAPPFWVAINLPRGLPWMVVVPTLWTNDSNAKCTYPRSGPVHPGGAIADVSWVLPFGGYSPAHNYAELLTTIAVVLHRIRPCS